MGRDLLLRRPARGGATVLGGVFRPGPRSGRAQSQAVPRSEWRGAVGLLRVRLHGAARSEAGNERDKPWRNTAIGERSGVSRPMTSASCRLRGDAPLFT